MNTRKPHLENLNMMDYDYMPCMPHSMPHCPSKASSPIYKMITRTIHYPNKTRKAQQEIWGISRNAHQTPALYGREAENAMQCRRGKRPKPTTSTILKDGYPITTDCVFVLIVPVVVSFVIMPSVVV